MSERAGVLQIRVADTADIPAISALQQRAISELQRGYLTPAQIEASRAAMGLDTQLIEDGTYFCVEEVGGEGTAVLVGCGGWSDRATLYGGDHSAGRSAARLDPATDRARIRAMYTHPEHARRGIGRMVIAASERAARERGFHAAEMAATEAGKPFYLSLGYVVEDSFSDHTGGVAVPLHRMARCL